MKQVLQKIRYYLFEIYRNNFVNFKGRARREEYWYNWLNISLFLLIITILYFFLFGFAAILWPIFCFLIMNRELVFLSGLIVLIPTIAAGTRRLHDIGKSGWWQLIALSGVGLVIFLYWCCKDGDKGANKYGEDPKKLEHDEENLEDIIV